jgi:hypothetical protein
MDAGVRTVNEAYTALGLTARWSKRSRRGFTWLPHERAQRIWTTEPAHSHGVLMQRVVAETELFPLPATPEALTRLAILGGQATMNALVVIDDVVRLRCAVLVYEEAQTWASELFQAAALVQAWEAETRAPALAEAFGAEPLLHQHPKSGVRPEPDDILGTLTERAVWAGRQRWTRRDFTQAIHWLSQHGIEATEAPGGLSLEFPFGRAAGTDRPGLRRTERGEPKASNLLRVTKERHPDLGWGLRLKLSLAAWPTKRLGVELLPSDLNALDEESSDSTHLVGSWSVERDGLAPFFTCFLPALLHGPGVLEEAITWMDVRSLWASRLLERRFAEQQHDQAADRGYSMGAMSG